MKYFLITALCVSLIAAKPQYNYPAPTAPTLPNIPGTNYGTPGVVLGGGGGYTGGLSTGLSAGGIGGLATGGGSNGFGVASGGISESFASSGVQSSLGIGGGGGVKVYKDIYVHVAPPEPEELRPAKTIAAGQSTKHYKIIFIKAPSYETYQQQILQQQAQNQEKTLVYVLVQKPEQPGDITLPTVTPTPPSKPEVYFIKYKAKSQVASGGVSGASIATGSSTSSITSGISSGGGSSSGIIGVSGGSGGGLINTGGVLGSGSVIGTGATRPTYGPPAQSGPY